MQKTWSYKQVLHFISAPTPGIKYRLIGLFVFNLKAKTVKRTGTHAVLNTLIFCCHFGGGSGVTSDILTAMGRFVCCACLSSFVFISFLVVGLWDGGSIFLC